MIQTEIRPKSCRICSREFIPFRPMQVACSVKCATKVPKLARKEAKEGRKQTKAKLLALKPKSHWVNLAQAEVNKYCRLRDAHLGCISCDKPATWTGGAWHASHFRSVGAAPQLRFCLWNLNRACDQCNYWKAGNIADYEPRLRARIGDKKVDALRSLNHTPAYSIEYLQRLRDVFRRKARRMEARRGP